MKLNFEFNSPFILFYFFISFISLVIDILIFPLNNYLALTSDIIDFRIYTFITYGFCHQNISHFIGNFTFILLLGPMLEFAYGTKTLVKLTIFTMIFTSIFYKLFFNNQALIGASGVVFLYIILSSFANSKKDSVPLTFVIVFILFIGKEIIGSLSSDNISQFAHIFGGILGSIFGFIIDRRDKRKN